MVNKKSNVLLLNVKLATNPRVACYKFFRMVSLNLFFTICINLINNNVFHNNIFIYYRNNHKS